MLSLTPTGDGSNTIYNSEVGENYHSKHGALQESKHVFLNSGLVHYLSLHPGSTQIKILEVGFGTGLNFLLSADYCSKSQTHLNYTGIEAYTLAKDLLEKTGYKHFVENLIWEEFLMTYKNAFSNYIPLNKLCNYRIEQTELLNFETEERFDILYFDAFAASRQPEMWTEEALERCCRHLEPGGVFVTYAITGYLKRTMKKLGFTIEKAKGAPGKREMLRATKFCSEEF